MLLSQLRLGKGIYVSIFNEKYPKGSTDFPSQIVDIINESEIIISALFYKGNAINLCMGDRVRVTFTHENGLFTFDGETTEIISEEGLLFYKLVLYDSIQRLQRREYFRITINIPLIYQMIKEDKEVYGKGITKDISGGGVRFVCSNKLDDGDKINVFVNLEPNIELAVLAKVIRCVQVEAKKYETCIEFITLDYNQRENLIKYIFDMQRNILRDNKKDL